jgi:hypothetical protein
MNKPWLGYVSAGLLLLAGIFMIVGQKPGIGGLFILLSIVSVILNIMMNKKK